MSGRAWMAGSRALCRRMVTAGGLAVAAAPGGLVLYVVVTLSTGSLPVVSAWLTKMLLDGLVGGAGRGQLLGVGAGLAGAGVVAGLAPQVSQYVRAEMDRRVGLLAQDRLFTAVDGFVGLGRFEDPRFQDHLRLAQQTGAGMPNQAVDGVLGVGRAAITIGGFLGSLLVLSPAMAGLVLVAGAPVLVAQIALSRRRARMLWSIGPVERREFVYADLLSNVAAAKEVRLFGIGGFLRQRMLSERRTANAEKRALDRRQVRVQAVLAVLAATVSGGGLLWALTGAQQGRLTVGDLTIFVAAVAGVQGALATLAMEVARAHHALLMLDHFVTVTSAGAELPVAAAPRPLGPLRHGIELRDVWFRYSEEHPWVLRGVNLYLPRGQAVALVGLNGAGKSTVVKLLCRFYDPDRGAILWDGVDIRDIDVAELRHRIGAVFQDYMRYDMTAAENIALGELDAIGDLDRIRAAAHRAGIDVTLAGLPRGYDTLLTRMFFTAADKDDPQTGVVLSGGQWQRLALARAFLRDRRDLMVLDEPSAGLDAEAEYEIHTSLRRHRAGQTSLLISHRLGAVRDADRIVVLGDGQIIEQGDHPTLMAAGGRYAQLFTRQASGYQAEPAW